MDNKYKELFTLISQTVANLAEQVMEQHKEAGDDKGYTTAETMRNDFLDLHDKLSEEKTLEKPDYARLLVGAIIVTNQLDARIKREEEALRGYKIDIIPKLDRVNNADGNEAAIELAEELFKIKEEPEAE